MLFSFYLGKYFDYFNGYFLKRELTKNGGKWSTKFYKNNNMEHTKMILCARTDLGMKKGKIAAQCCHACLGVVNIIKKNNDQLLLDIWKSYGTPKIVTKLTSLTHMNEIESNAQDKGIPTYKVCDAGKTQIPSGSYTVLAVGPAPDSIINSVTKSLKLL